MSGTSSALCQQELICKVILHWGRTLADITATARRLTHPYQLWIPPAQQDFELVLQALAHLTEANPHTPLELVFCDPARLPDAQRLLQSACLARPHYLDGDLRPMDAKPGNRAMLITVVTQSAGRSFSGPMQRLVHWWRQPGLPGKAQLQGIGSDGFDGLLIDAPLPDDRLHHWQDEIAPEAGDLLLITFSSPALQKRWLRKTAADDYCLDILPPSPGA